MDEVDVEPVGLGDELRQGVQPGRAPLPVVVGRPVAREILHRRERHALRVVVDGLPLGPARCRDTPAEVLEGFVRKVDVEGPDLGGARWLFGGDRHAALLSSFGGRAKPPRPSNARAAGVPRHHPKRMICFVPARGTRCEACLCHVTGHAEERRVDAALRNGNMAASFFDDPQYLSTVVAEKAPKDSAAQAHGAARLAGCGTGALILDAACGNGRHSLPLANAGFRVVGLDRSRLLLRAARRAAGGAKWPHFVRGSYARLPLESARFDAVLWLGTALGYLGDGGDRMAMREFRRALAARPPP